MLNHGGTRRWNDHKVMKDLKRGSFTDVEILTLRSALCEFVAEQGMGTEGLEKLCSEGVKENAEMRGAWCKIAECLPNRSLQSCHNVCRRKFNPNNYKGGWSLEQMDTLIELQRMHGNQWKLIGELLQRTAENVRDKFREIGSLNSTRRVKGPWTLHEQLLLINLVAISLDIPILTKKVVLKYLGGTVTSSSEDGENVPLRAKAKKVVVYQEQPLS